MTQATTKKLNRAGASHSGRIMRITDKGFFGDLRLSATKRIIFNALYSFCQKGNLADFTYSELRDRYNLSYASVLRAVRDALKNCYQLGLTANTYQPKKAFAIPKHYFYIFDWLRFAEFPADGIPSTLSYNECEILSYIMHQQRRVRGWYCSQAQIARDLDIAPSTVSKVLSRLEGRKILKRSCSAATRKRAANHHERAYYIVNNDLLQTVKDRTIKRAKGVPQSVREADARTDRDRFYALRKNRAYAHVNAVTDELRKTALGREILELKARLDELRNEAQEQQKQRNMDTVRSILEKRQKIHRAMKEKLETFGYTEQDLEPRFECLLCHDTGWRIADGRACNCYIPPTGGHA